MQLLLEILASAIILIPAVVVLYLFIQAARKDGEEDRALQERLGIRRKTRLGK